MTTTTRPTLITTGEPAGIGMDIVIDVLAHHRDKLPQSVWILADANAFEERIQMLPLAQDESHFGFEVVNADDWRSALGKIGVVVLHIECIEKVCAGSLNVANAHMVQRQLDLAHDLANAGVVGAIVTAPIQKSVMIDAGICLDNGDMFSGHTEYFMHKASCQKVVMMLANSKMKVALVTTHLPLKDVADAITPWQIEQTAVITHQALVSRFGIDKPNILVCGLNPHAGEGGHLGEEELTIINPTLQKLQEQGMGVSLAMPADTLFTTRHLQTADAVIAMYHDQGLPVLKSHGFGDTVNITLGLPYVRTSVDHGTALDLAGTGQASSSSLLVAIHLAIAMQQGEQNTPANEDEPLG